MKIENKEDLDKMFEEIPVIFQNKVGTHLMDAHWALQSGSLENVEKAKGNFYAALEEFVAAGHGPSGKLNTESLTGFDEFKNIDWKDKENLKKVVDYFNSIAY